MVFRPRQATSGTILCLASAILLALVSFNTPLLKSMYFLEANYSTGQYAGRIRLGTLGYCLLLEGTETCVGPTVGYNFNPNTLFGITNFNIPEAITRYLTYTLILHIVALGAAVAAVILGLFDHISTLSLLCFPTCSAWLTSTCALLALIFDLVIFYIAKTRIDAVSGASASIGISVWLTLAAWLCAGLSGCAFPLGKKWGSKKRESGDPHRDNGYGKDYGAETLRLRALQDEQARKKEQGLPSFAEVERQPLTANEDKYYYEEPQQQQMPGGLRRDGSVLNGVGVGYGRRTPRSNEGHGGQYLAAGAAGAGAAGMYARSGTPGSLRPPASEMSYPGNAGVGAGGAGVERNQPQGHGGYDGGYYDQQGHDQYYQNGQQPYADPYNPIDAYGNRGIPESQSHGQMYPPSSSDHGYDPTPTQNYDYSRHASDPSSGFVNPYPAPVPQTYPPAAAAVAPGSGFSSYPNPHDDQRPTSSGPYGGYDEDETDPGALGVIGMMAQSNAGRQGGDYTGQQGYSNAQVVAPRPQHLADQRGTAEILRHAQSPMSPESDIGAQRGMIVGSHPQQQGRGYGYGAGGQGQGQGSDEGHGGGSEAPPPSYAPQQGYAPQPEKAGYRPGR